MGDYGWRWQTAREHPSGATYDGDGWYVCMECGANERDEAHSELGIPFPAGGPIPSSCPRNELTAVFRGLAG
jgi:hypothetical protein